MLRPAAALAAAALLACAGGGTSARGAVPGEDAARETLRRFALALRAGRFDAAAPLLSARWRAAYGPGRLALDWAGAGPSAREMAERVLARLDAGERMVRSGTRAALPISPSREAIVVAEDGAWRVDALE